MSHSSLLPILGFRLRSCILLLFSNLTSSHINLLTMLPPPASPIDELSSPVSSAISTVPSSFGRSHALLGAAATQNESELKATIPSKFLATPQSFVRDDLVTAARRVPQSKAQTGSRSTSSDWHGSIPQPTALHGHDIPPKTPAPTEGLPEIPNWAVHLLAGSLSFLVVVAVVLYFVQFPPRFTWLTKIKRGSKFGYTTVRQEDNEVDKSSSERSSAVASSWDAAESDGKTKPNGLRRRRASGLTIKTNAQYHGLGIAAPGLLNVPTPSKKRRSYDEESLRRPPMSPAVAAWNSFTAPLPSGKTFISPQEARAKTADIETGTRRMQSTCTSPEMFDYRSPCHFRSGAGDDESAGGAVFKMIGSGVTDAADRISKKFYDQVNGAEEGLILPVHNGERQQPITPGVFDD